MLEEILIVLILSLSIPAGYLIAWMARDELTAGRKWFKILMIVSTIGFILFIIFKDYIISSSFIVIFIVSFISLKKSFGKKWTKKRI